MNILIMNDTLHLPHHGCQATSMMLRELLLERFPGACISADAQKAPSIWEFMPLERSVKRATSRFSPIAPPLPDLVVMNGEGTLHACGRPIKRRNGGFLLRLAQMERALEAGVEGWIVNHSLFTDRDDYLAMLAGIYPRLGQVTVREPHSLALAKRLNERAALGADCAFLTPLPSPAEDSPLTGAILLTDSSLRRRWGTMGRLRKFIAHLKAETGRRVAYLSIFTHGIDCADVAVPLGIPGYYFQRTDDFLAHLQQAAFVLAGRYHTAVFSARCGVPFATMRANTPKNTAVIDLLEYDVPCFDPEGMDCMAAARKVAGMVERREELRGGLVGGLARVQGLACKNVFV